jgi:SAM-dependent MidA family methyltransferase
MSYDPDERRDTPLALALQDRIRREGAVSVRDYMDACLNDPGHGYYRARVAIGRAGDFVTAPEISQVFGELIGLWAAVVWQQMGAPSPFNLVELGPGRGTMMADAIRAARRVMGFTDAVRVALVEPSPVLARVQQKTLDGAPADIRWYTDLANIEAAPTVLIANEMLDVVPVTQLLRSEGGWHERCVGLDDRNRLVFAARSEPSRVALPEIGAQAAPGDILELRDLSGLARAVSRIAAADPFAGLFIDYGHAVSALGDTLQAVRAHRHEHPLTSPGEADLTAYVDFAAAASTFASAGLIAERLVAQAEFLGALGIVARASRLMAANPGRAADIEMAVARLMAPQGMGTRFKALGLKSPGLPPLPGFP